MRTKIAAMLAGSSLLALASPALAQPAQPAPAAAEDESGDEIVVTGTFIRGVAPTGNQVLGLSQEDVAASGAVSTKDLLADIPQVSNFFNSVNAVGLTGGGNAGTFNQASTIQVQRPELRNVGSNTLGSFPTLVMMDGHRIVGAGVNQSSPDVGLIPPGAIERVEVVTDGGSALYGTDAIGGVINFITRRSFDGVRVNGRYGIGDGFDTYDANLTAGTSWDSGSIFGSAAFSESEAVFGADRDWFSAVNWNPNAPFGQYLQGSERRCPDPNVTAGGPNYPVTGTGPVTFGAANTFNFCDALDRQSISPDQTMESFLGGITQELTSNIEFNLRATYAHRESTNYVNPYEGSVTITPANVTRYRPIAAAPGVNHTVQFDYSPFTGDEGKTQTIDLETWSIVPAVVVDLPGDWQLNALVNYGESETFFRNQEYNTTRQGAYAASGGLDPYDLLNSSPGVLADILNWQRYGFAHQQLINYRAVFDGPLLTLPGGEVRGAFGAEFLQEEIERREGFTNRGAEGTLPLLPADRDLTAFFGELNIPIVGPGNRLPLVESLTLAVSARRDDYSDFGETTNPQVGLVWEPTEWLSIRANWGESFNAASPIEVLQQEFLTVQVNPISFGYPGAVTQPGDVRVDGTPIPQGTPVLTAGEYQALYGVTPINSIGLNGAQPGLEPQLGETWSLGFDAHAPFLPNLRISATYYNIKFTDTLFSFQNAVFTQTATNYANFSEFIFLNGTHGTGPNGRFTPEDITNFCGLSTNPSSCAGVAGNPDTVFAMYDLRLDNRGSTLQEGVDVSMRYSHDFDWGTLDTGFSGNYRINSETQNPATGIVTINDLDNGSRYRVSANVGATMGDFYARATVNYRAGYDQNFNGGLPVTPSSGGPFQIGVDPFVLTDLFFRYDLGEIGMADALQLTLNVNNVFDEDPPEFRQSNTTSAANGDTLGRVFMVGLTADF